MANAVLGVVAAGHELSARAGADALRAGGNAVDAAIAAMLTGACCEPLLTGLGAGGYMLIVAPGRDPVVLDFFVEAPGRGLPAGTPGRARLDPVQISFGAAEQVFHIGPASVGSYGVPAGVAHASARYGRLALAELTAPAARLARDGVRLTRVQAYLIDLLQGLVLATPESAAIFAPGGALLRAGDVLRNPALGDCLDALGSGGAAPFYDGPIGAAIVDWLSARGGLLTMADLRAYGVVERPPLRTSFRGQVVLTNPPPSAGGILIVRALQVLDAAGGGPPGPPQLIAAMEESQAARTPAFLDGLTDVAFVDAFVRGAHGSTTHTSVIDASGLACAVTTSNGSSSGVVVPGTGIQLNNMLGEQDLNPSGFFRYPPGRRLPSMMAPTAVLGPDGVRLILGSAGSNRIRSAVLQTIVRVIDDGLDVRDAVLRPRLHVEDGVVFAEPGIDLAGIDGRYRRAPFEARNLFFGGVQAVSRSAGGALAGAGDPRRGGAAVVAD